MKARLFVVLMVGLGLFNGISLADAFHTQMMIGGGILEIIDLALLIKASLAKSVVGQFQTQEEVKTM